MPPSKVTETLILSILKEVDAGRPVNEIWKQYGISSVAKSCSGFWKSFDRLRLDGQPWIHKKVWQIYCVLRLNLPPPDQGTAPAPTPPTGSA